MRERLIILILASVITWPSPGICVCVQISSSYKDTSHVGLRAHLNPAWYHLILWTSSKTQFPNKVMFTGSRWTWIFGMDTTQPSTVRQEDADSSALPHFPLCAMQWLPEVFAPKQLRGRPLDTRVKTDRAKLLIPRNSLPTVRRPDKSPSLSFFPTVARIKFQ